MTRGARKSSPPPPTTPAYAATGTLSPDSPRVRVASHVAAVAVTIVLLALVAFMSAWPLMWAADNFTDANVLLAGENFAHLGFWKLRLLPVHYLTPSTDNPIYYLHYPPLDTWVNGALQSLGIRSLYVMRLICGCLFVAGLLSMYRAFTPLIGPLAAVCGLALIGTGGFFLGYATSLHHSYNVFFLGLFLLFFLTATRSEQPPARTWCGAWIALLLASLVSYEFILYTQIFAWAYVIATRQLRRHWKALVLLGTAPIIGVGLHFLQNCWAVGWSATLADGFGYDVYTEKGRWYWLNQLPMALITRSTQRFFWPLPGLLLVAVLLSRSERIAPDLQTRGHVGALFLATLLAPLGWGLVLTRHVVIHPHTAGQLLPLVFVIMGCAVAWMLRELFERKRTPASFALACLGLLALAGGQAQTVRWRLNECQATVVEYIEGIGANALPDRTAVLHNTTAPHFAYIVRRPAWRSLIGDRLLPFPQCLPDLQRRLPADWKLQYFMFFGSGDRDTFNLLASTCPGKRLAQAGGFQIVLFDISELLRPEAERKPLAADVREKQLRGIFPEWSVPGFVERVEQALTRFPKTADE